MKLVYGVTFLFTIVGLALAASGQKDAGKEMIVVAAAFLVVMVILSAKQLSVQTKLILAGLVVIVALIAGNKWVDHTPTAPPQPTPTTHLPKK
jgi:hypothetical protein